LRVRFHDGTPAEHERFLRIANRWSEAAKDGIRFRESADRDAEIRVAFRRKMGVWSFLGTDALAIADDQPTMNIGLPENATEANWSQAVLRECGHALGLINETSNPYADLVWNEQAVYGYFHNLGWTQQQIRTNLFQKYAVSELPWYREFDPKSVMASPIPAGLAVNRSGQPMVIGDNTDLSDGDKRFIAALYPPVGSLRSVVFDKREEGICPTFRALHRYQFSLADTMKLQFLVEIHPNAGFSLLRLPGGDSTSGRPSEVQTLTTPTEKAHRFTLELQPGRYLIDFFGQLPTQRVPPPFGPRWVRGEPIPDWDGKYQFTVLAGQ
jgi:hypothetical protein